MRTKFFIAQRGTDLLLSDEYGEYIGFKTNDDAWFYIGVMGNPELYEVIEMEVEE